MDLLQWDSFDVAHDHPAEGGTQVVNHSEVRLFGQQVGKHRQHHGVVSGNHFTKEELCVMFVCNGAHSQKHTHTGKKDTIQRWAQLPGPDTQVQTRCCCGPQDRRPSLQQPARGANDWTAGLPIPGPRTHSPRPAGFLQSYPLKRIGLPRGMRISSEGQRQRQCNTDQGITL